VHVEREKLVAIRVARVNPRAARCGKAAAVLQHQPHCWLISPSVVRSYTRFMPTGRAASEIRHGVGAARRRDAESQIQQLIPHAAVMRMVANPTISYSRPCQRNIHRQFIGERLVCLKSFGSHRRVHVAHQGAPAVCDVGSISAFIGYSARRPPCFGYPTYPGRSLRRDIVEQAQMPKAGVIFLAMTQAVGCERVPPQTAIGDSGKRCSLLTINALRSRDFGRRLQGQVPGYCGIRRRNSCARGHPRSTPMSRPGTVQVPSSMFTARSAARPAAMRRAAAELRSRPCRIPRSWCCRHIEPSSPRM